MANVIKSITGSELLQIDLPNYNFTYSDQENLHFTPASPVTELEHGLAYNTFHPTEGMVTWIKAEAKWTYNNDLGPATAIDDFKAVFGLYGIMEDGSEHLIGESVYSTPMGTGGDDTEITTFFDLKSSGGNPPVYKDTGTATAGRVRLNLPFRAENLEDIGLYKTWTESSYTGRNMHAVINTTSTPVSNGVAGPLWVETVSPGGDSLQRDILFVDNDGTSGLCFYRDPMTTTTPGEEAGHNGHAKYYVKIPYLPGDATGKVIYSYYGGQGATPTDLSTGFMVFDHFDDWEDGLVTGRTLPYTDWTNPGGGGSAGVDAVSPIQGNYSLKCTGPGIGGDDNYLQAFKYIYGGAYTVEFDWMVFQQGTDTYTPYICLWYLDWKDNNNYIRVDTYWTGSYQVLRVQKMDGGSPTSLATYNLSASRYNNGDGGHLRIVDWQKAHVAVWWGNYRVIDVDYTYSWTTLNRRGFGANRNTIATFDNFLAYYSYELRNSLNFNNPAERWYQGWECGQYVADDFNDNSIDTNKWRAVLGSGASTPAETNQEIRVSGTGTHRAHLRTYRAQQAPWVSHFRAKKSENIEYFFDWHNGAINTSNYDYPASGYGFMYASWEATKQFQIRRFTGSGDTVLATAAYTLDSNYHQYRIERSYNTIRVYLDGNYILGTYDSLYLQGYHGFSSRETPAAVNAYYDDFELGGFLRARDSYVPITPVSITTGSTYVEFATPSDWLDGGPYHFGVTEVLSGEYRTGNINLTAQDVARLGYDNVDKYQALRFKIEIEGTDTDFRLNDIEYHYDVG